MITCLLTTYNEWHRIESFLKHATQWADEVLVCDKGSTDHTQGRAKLHGARVVDVPFSLQGHENNVRNIAMCKHDWVFLMTPGETPTRELIQTVKAKITMAGDGVDVFGIPKKLYSFGIHDPRSPWSIGCQPMLFHRHRATITNRVHANITGGRFHAIPYSDTCHVLHPTHATVTDFLRSHFDYILAESEGQTPDELLNSALKNLNCTDFGNHARELFGHECAWKLYWLGCCLAAWSKKEGRDVPAQYRALTESALADWI